MVAPIGEADLKTLFRVTSYSGTKEHILSRLKTRMNESMTPGRVLSLQKLLNENETEVQSWEDQLRRAFDSSIAASTSGQTWPQRGTFVFDPIAVHDSVVSDTFYEAASIRGPAISDGELYFGIRMAENFLYGFYRFDPETGVTVKVGELDSRKTGYRAAYAVAEHYLIFDVEKGILNLDTTTGQWTSHPTGFFRSMTDSQICTDHDRTIYFAHPVEDNPQRAKIIAYDVINGTTRDIIAFSGEEFGSPNRNISDVHLLLLQDRYLCLDLAGDFRNATAYDLIARRWVAISDRRDDLSGMVPGLSSSNPTVQEVKEFRSAQSPWYFISEDGTEWRLPETLLAPDGSEQLPFTYQFLFDARRSKDERVAYATMTDAPIDQVQQKANAYPLLLRGRWSFKEGILFNASPPYFGYWISSDDIDTLFQLSEPHVN